MNASDTLRNEFCVRVLEQLIDIIIIIIIYRCSVEWK